MLTTAIVAGLGKSHIVKRRVYSNIEINVVAVESCPGSHSEAPISGHACCDRSPDTNVTGSTPRISPLALMICSIHFSLPYLSLTSSRRPLYKPQDSPRPSPRYSCTHNNPLSPYWTLLPSSFLQTMKPIYL